MSTDLERSVLEIALATGALPDDPHAEPVAPSGRSIGATAPPRGRMSSVATRGLVSHLDLNVALPSESVIFYSLVLGHLGYAQHDIEHGRARWSIEYADGALFEIEVRPPAVHTGSDRHERYSPGIDHLAFHAKSRADVDELHAKLVAAGHPVAEPPRGYDYAPRYYAVAFDDPSGIRIEVVHDPTTNP